MQGSASASGRVSHTVPTFPFVSTPGHNLRTLAVAKPRRTERNLRSTELVTTDYVTTTPCDFSLAGQRRVDGR